jgi:DNA-binding NarL/FixJ family response regulator
LANKQTAAEFGTSEITIGVHRGQIMRKMGARSLASAWPLAERDVRMADSAAWLLRRDSSRRAGQECAPRQLLWP